MAKFDTDDSILARQADQSLEESPLSDELRQQTKPPEKDAKKPEGDPTQKDGETQEEPLQEGESKTKLETGDTLVSTFAGDILLMSDGSRVGFTMPESTDSNIALEQLHTRLHVRDAEGKPIAVKYSATLTGLPPTDVYTMSDGSNVKVSQGIALMTLGNGTQIYMDELGIFAVKRGDKGAVVREPEIVGPLWKPITPDPRKMM